MSDAGLFFGKDLIDTVLNIIVFVFIGVLVWLYTAAPTKCDNDDQGSGPAVDT